MPQKVYGYSSITKEIYEKIEETLTATEKNMDRLVTLKEIREILKTNQELLWYYPIYNDNGIFCLQGMKTFSGRYKYLHLETNNPFLKGDMSIYFDLDIESSQMSINTRNDDLNLKV